MPLDELRVTDAAGPRARRPRRGRGRRRRSARSPSFEAWLAAQPLVVDDDARLVRRVVELAETTARSCAPRPGAARAASACAPLQRLVREQLGLTPKWLIRRYRMQEAAAALAAPEAPSLADLAAELGFADQAHLTREFRAVIGETPRRYALAAGSAAASVDRSIAASADASADPTSRRALTRPEGLPIASRSRPRVKA